MPPAGKIAQNGFGEFLERRALTGFARAILKLQPYISTIDTTAIWPLDRTHKTLA